MDLNTKIEKLNKVGKVTASRLKRLGIETARDLLFYFPFRYEDFRTIKKINDLRDGDMATVKGKIEIINNKRSFRARKIITEALIADESGSARVVWFGQPFIKNILKAGDNVFLSGKAKEDMLGIQLVSPAYEKVRYDTLHTTLKGGTTPFLSTIESGWGDLSKDPLPTSPLKGGGEHKIQTTHTARLVPMYPLTANLTQKQIRFLVSQVVGLADEISEWISEEILEKQDLILLSQALRGIHFPKDEVDLKQSTNRLKFDELFLLQIKAELSRQEKAFQKAPVIDFKEAEIKNFVKNLPFTLTKTQKISAWEILRDLGKPNPMNRLLSGDVGSGKTVVAGIAMYNAVLNGYQCAMMSPTEILAIQHYNTIQKILGDKLCVGLLTRNQFSIFNFEFSNNSKIFNFKKRDILLGINSGKIDIIVGTQALLSEGVKFKKLGLVVVDEQHRFGVNQRKMIKEKSSTPPQPSPYKVEGGQVAHFLSMTATPIPRSLALMIYGDLDVSIINELPAGRKLILTRLVEPINRQKAYDFIRKQIQQGRQVFVVCPLIEENDGNDKKSVISEYEKLSKNVFPDLKIGYLHGKLKSKEKEEIMSKFSAKGGSASGGQNNKINILVSTSVIEVGIDIPNASVMMIEGAERFGLAQLHQFRGRVGRGSHQSYCFLFMEHESSKAKDRLQFFEKHNDGFKLAEKDLETRGPGEVYGTAQSGLMNLRLAKLTDRDIIKKARDSAREVIGNLNKYPKLIKKVKEWENKVHFE